MSIFKNWTDSHSDYTTDPMVVQIKVKTHIEKLEIFARVLFAKLESRSFNVANMFLPLFTKSKILAKNSEFTVYKIYINTKNGPEQARVKLFLANNEKKF